MSALWKAAQGKLGINKQTVANTLYKQHWRMYLPETSFELEHDFEAGKGASGIV